MDEKFRDLVIVQIPILLAFGCFWLISLALPKSFLTLGALLIGAAVLCAGLSLLPVFQRARLRITKRKHQRE